MSEGRRVALVGLVLGSLIVTSIASDACQTLAICALDNCVPANTTFPPKQQLISDLLERANFGCVIGPACYDQCIKCSSCKYAQENVKRLLLHEETVGRCPKLERCAQSCLEDKVADPFNCVFKSRCVHYCLDAADCAPCRDIVRRVFTGFCFRNNFIEHYGRKCRPMFDELAAQLIESRQ